MRFRVNNKAFTLAELLIALLILSVIATFTIPKVLTVSQNSHHKAIAKEAAAAVSEAYQVYKFNNSVSASTSLHHLTPVLNYVRVISTSFNVDNKHSLGQVNCAGVTCLKLHNGAVLWYNVGSGYSVFGGTALTNAILFSVDPDGVYSGSTNGPGKAVEFAIYTNGALTSRANMRAGTTTGAGGAGAADPTEEPPWFSWN